VPNDLWRKLLQKGQRLVSNPHAQECRVLIRRIFGESEAMSLQVEPHIPFASSDERANHILRTRSQHRKPPRPGTA
jgi:hypothetical protein